ncbi:hypothetical protein X742_06360 [Mesorhizobium sp. LNHC232B00]|nr:hypothetical protein X742_06360 [Mesorhizobium sp. LNHC232B00]
MAGASALCWPATHLTQSATAILEGDGGFA